MYKNESIQGIDDVFRFPLSSPKVPQQEENEKCGTYVLYYMFNLLMTCPTNFNINEDGGFVSLYICNSTIHNRFLLINLNKLKHLTDEQQLVHGVETS